MNYLYRVERLSDGRTEEGTNISELGRRFGYTNASCLYSHTQFKMTKTPIEPQIKYIVTDNRNGNTVSGATLKECSEKLGYKMMSLFSPSAKISRFFTITDAEGNPIKKERTYRKKYEKHIVKTADGEAYGAKKRKSHNKWLLEQFDLAQGVVMVSRKGIKYNGDVVEFESEDLKRLIEKQIKTIKRKYLFYMESAETKAGKSQRVLSHQFRIDIFVRFDEDLNKGYKQFSKFKEECEKLFPLLDEIDMIIDDYMEIIKK